MSEFQLQRIIVMKTRVAALTFIVSACLLIISGKQFLSHYMSGH